MGGQVVTRVHKSNIPVTVECPFIFFLQNFKREEQNFVVQNEINNMSFLISDTKCKMSKVWKHGQMSLKTWKCAERLSQTLTCTHSFLSCWCVTLAQGIVSDQERKKMKRKGDRYSMQTSLIVATLKRLLPVGLNICAPGEQELIALAKNRFSQVVKTRCLAAAHIYSSHISHTTESHVCYTHTHIYV